MTLLPLRGSALQPYLSDLGRLRITVFRDYPYLYEGSLDYEQDYLQRYLAAEDSLTVLALDGSAVVGATTCLPLVVESAEFQKPFRDAGIPVKEVCYFGESILLSQYRGQGVGRAFFQHREAHAQQLGLSSTAFCAVDRPIDHALRPLDYVPLDAFWTRLGYVKQPGLQASFHWKEVGEDTESAKTLTFWMKQISA
jgi:GNAT superfamily N-acetyltransferase